MTEFAIKLKNLHKTYASDGHTKTHTALKGIDLDIPRGSIYGLLGPNGAGKSTLINILAGLVIKTAGSVEIWGFDQDKNPRQSRVSIGVMPQEINFDPFLAPFDSLEIQAGLYGVPPKMRRSKEILELVGLGAQAYAYARTLSGGMKRRLLLAKALVHNPAILVLDEPTAGVDIELRNMLWSNIRHLNKQGMTIILTTHYLQEAEEICDRIAIVNKGHIIAEDATDALVKRLDQKSLAIVPTPETQTFLCDHDIVLPEGVKLTRREADGTFIFHYRRSQIRAEKIFDILAQHNVHILDITTQQPNLEDVFLELTSAK